MPDIGGFHHDFMTMIEKSGIFEFSNKKILENGLCFAELRYVGNKVKDITFFPSYWSREQVMENIIEACEHFVKNNKSFVDLPGGKYLIESTTTEGIVIRMFVTKNGLVTSAYPILK